MKWALLALLLAAAPNAVFTLYAQGHYDDAMRQGEASGSAAGLAIAARAALADAMVRAPCLSCLERADVDARRAIAANPRLADGHVWLAASLGYQARIRGVVWAKLEGNADRAKRELDAALAADPDNAYALAALGGWNVEVARVGGRFLAEKLYGAGVDHALALFDRAVRAAPKNVAVHYQIALALAGFDMDTYRARVERELAAAVAGPPETAYERFVAARAEELLGLLTRGDRDAFKTRLRTFQGYPE